ncbi:MAG: PAS domain S-box protein [Pleurocapsa minor GSE-CHR-MK-17-07R]|jgi:PAS domain S-box-containing protein|nr:PAS domain S-box protein [Pleurocapsa minor GSE-CHR-MK 17-07R]
MNGTMRQEQVWNESRFAQLIDCSLDGILMTDETGIIVEWNAAMETITAIPSADVVGRMMVWEVLSLLTPAAMHSPDRDALEKAFVQELLLTGRIPGSHQLYDRELHTTRNDSVIVEISVFAFASGSGFGVGNIIRDVTANRRMQMHLKTLEQAVQQSPATVLITDADGHIEYANPRLEELTGYSLDDVRGMTPRVFKSDMTDRSVYEAMWQSIKNGHEWRGQILNRKKDGQTFWEDTHISPVFDETGTLKHFVAVKQDITALRDSIQALSDSEERFRATFEQAAVGIAHVAPDGHFLLINQKFCDMLGYSHEDLLAMDFQSVTHPEDLKPDLDLVGQMLSGELEDYSLIKRYIRDDDSVLWVELTVSLVRHPDGSPKHFISVVQDISKRKAALDALERSEFTLKRSQQVAHVGDWTWHTASNSLRWSDEMYRIFGIDQASFTGDLNDVIARAIHPEDRSKVSAANEAVVHDLRPAPLEYRVIWPDGSVRYIWAQPGDKVTDEHGTIVSLSGIVQDITERKLAELRLYESERFAESTVNALSSEIAILDEAGVILKVNKAWKSFATENNGRVENTGEGINYLTVLDHTDAASPDAIYAFAFSEGLRAVMNGSLSEYELEYPCDAPTEKRWFVGKVTRFKGEGPLRLVVAHEDITTRKQSEIAIQRANQELQALHATVSQQNVHLEREVEERTAQLSRVNDRLTTILNNTSDAILLLDAHDHIETVNRGFSSLFGYEQDESAGGTTSQSLIDISYREQVNAAMHRARAENLTQRVQVPALRRDGRTFDADISLTHVENNEGHLVCSIRDITFLKGLDRAKDAFLSMVSHELRTPVSTIALSSESLSLYYDRIPEENRKLKILQIYQQTTVMAELINAILDTARFAAASHEETPVSVDIQRALHDVVTELLPQAETKDQRITIAHDIVPIMVNANATNISRVWRNLISNAIKYTGPGSTITASLIPPAGQSGGRQVYPDFSSFGDRVPSDLTTGNYVIGLVEDDGPGIHEEHLAQMFTRFFRGWASSTDIPGTGLGLSMVRDILQSYHGDIAVSNRPTGGSRFCFWLPLSAGHMQPKPTGEMS